MSAAGQLGLFSHQTRLDREFTEWLASNEGQAITQAIIRRALSLKEAGWAHYGIKALWETARYDRALAVGPDAAGYRLNNNWPSRLARHIMRGVPELAGFFETRELRS